MSREFFTQQRTTNILAYRLHQQTPLPSDFQLGSAKKSYEEIVKVETSELGNLPTRLLPYGVIVCHVNRSRLQFGDHPHRVALNRSQWPRSSPALVGPDVTRSSIPPSFPCSLHLPSLYLCKPPLSELSSNYPIWACTCLLLKLWLTQTGRIGKSLKKKKWYLIWVLKDEYNLVK